MRMAMRLLLVMGVLAAAARAQVDDESVGARFLEQERIAFAHYEAQRWPAAITAFEQQIAIHPDNPRPYYNIACAYALQGNAERAAIWLKLTIDHGWRNEAHLDADADWTRVRGSDTYKRVRARLAEIARRDPPPMPRRLPIGSALPASSVAAIQAAAMIGERQLDLDPRLLEERETRRRLFALYDIVMARLARYIAENGDAHDADRAGRERVRIASLYGLRARDGDQADDALRSVGATYVRLTAEEFVERWPGSPALPDVLFWRAVVEPDDKAVEQLARIRDDFPGTDAGARASAEWCVLQQRNVMREVLAAAYRRFVADYLRTEIGRELIATRLWRVRLRVHSLPGLESAQLRPPLAEPNVGSLMIAVVIAGDEESEAMLAKMRKRAAGSKLVVAAFPARRDADDDRWLAEHAQRMSIAGDPSALVGLLRIPDAPMLLEFRDGYLRR